MSKPGGKKINVEQIDLERMKEFVTENPGILPYAHQSGSALVKPEDVGKVKGRAVAAMHSQTDMQMTQIYKQMELLAQQAAMLKKRVEVSERIYQTQMSFEPLINHVYYLYERKDGQDMLSMVAPNEWGRKLPFNRYVAKVKLLADHTWEILEEGSNGAEA